MRRENKQIRFAVQARNNQPRWAGANWRWKRPDWPACRPHPGVPKWPFLAKNTKKSGDFLCQKRLFWSIN